MTGQVDADEVLVEDSWFKRSELPTILGNFMRLSAEYAREAKAAHIALAEAERRGAEKGWDEGAAWFAYWPQHTFGPEYRVKGTVLEGAQEANPYREGDGQ